MAMTDFWRAYTPNRAPQDPFPIGGEINSFKTAKCNASGFLKPRCASSMTFSATRACTHKSKADIPPHYRRLPRDFGATQHVWVSIAGGAGTRCARTAKGV